MLPAPKGSENGLFRSQSEVIPNGLDPKSVQIDEEELRHKKISRFAGAVTKRVNRV